MKLRPITLVLLGAGIGRGMGGGVKPISGLDIAVKISAGFRDIRACGSALRRTLADTPMALRQKFSSLLPNEVGNSDSLATLI